MKQKSMYSVLDKAEEEDTCQSSKNKGNKIEIGPGRYQVEKIECNC